MKIRQLSLSYLGLNNLTMNYRYMRVLVLFDLPTGTRAERKAATKFRNFLVGNGFDMLQYSVYSRLCPNRDVAQKHLGRVVKNVPKDTDGSIRVLVITEHQFTNMFTVLGEKTEQEKQIKSEQLTFF